MPTGDKLWSPVIGDIYLRSNGGANGNGVTPAGMSQFDRTILRHLNQLPWDHEFHVAEPVTLLASAVNQRVVDFSPDGMRCGIVRGVAMGVAVFADFDNIRWGIRVDGMFWPGFENIQGPFGVFVYPKPILIPLLPDQTVDVVATNLTAVDIPFVTAYLMGTHFPVDLDPPAGS
jgi:hypothetical protein